MTVKPPRFVGHPDFHDGSVLAISRTGDKLHVTIRASGGRRYVVRFDGVSSIESESPEGMMLYALSEAETEAGSLFSYEFINWHVDRTDEPRSKSHLRIVASSFTVVDLD